MKVIFMGTPDFAVATLDALVKAGYEIPLVITQPDRPKGRHGEAQKSDVRIAAEGYGIRVATPERIRKDEALQAEMRALAPDVIVVTAFGQILPKDILEIPKYGCVNVHASLLPKYRGAAPIQWAILDGETETGVTIMQMDAGLDTGDMLLVKKTPIDPEETAEMLFERLSALGAQALAEILPRLDDLHPVPQPAGDFGYAKMISKSMSPLDWNHSAAQLHDQVRGLYSWPCA